MISRTPDQFCLGFPKSMSIFAVGCNRNLFWFILVLLHSGCVGKINQQSDSELLPPVHPIEVDHMILKTEIEPTWNLVTGNLLSLRSPIPSAERKVRDLETIGDGIRSMVFLGSAATVEGKPFLFENGITAIRDSSVPKGVSQNPLVVLEDIYQFDSRINCHSGEYREFLYSAAVFFRHRDVQKVIVVDDLHPSHQVILFQGIKSNVAFVICEVFANTGRGLARIKFTSTPDDIDWIFDSVSTIVVN